MSTRTANHISRRHTVGRNYRAHSQNGRRHSLSSERHHSEYRTTNRSHSVGRPEHKYGDYYYQRGSQPSSRHSSDSRKNKPVAKYDPCSCGPDFFTSVLGPTPDETFLVGLQTIFGFCIRSEAQQGPDATDGHQTEEENSTESVPTESHPTDTNDNGQEHSHTESSHQKPSEHQDDIPEKKSHEQDNQDSDDETELANISESQFLETIPENSERENAKSSEKSTEQNSASTLPLVSREPSLQNSTRSAVVQKTVATSNRGSQTEAGPIQKTCYCQLHCICKGPQIGSTASPSYDTADKSSSTYEYTVSTGEMSHSSQTDYPSSENRTSQTLAEKRRKEKRNCICKVIPEETTSEPSLKKNHCNCASCCNKRRTKQSRRGTRPAISCTSRTKSKCICSSPSCPANVSKKTCACSSSEVSCSTEDDENNILMQNGQVGLVKYAITKITKFCSYTTFEIMKSTRKKPKVMPQVVEGVFVLKNTQEQES